MNRQSRQSVQIQRSILTCDDELCMSDGCRRDETASAALRTNCSSRIAGVVNADDRPFIIRDSSQQMVSKSSNQDFDFFSGTQGWDLQ